MTTAPAVDMGLMGQMITTALAPENRPRPWRTPGEMAVALDRSTIQTPALELIDEHLARVAEGAVKRMMFSVPPQEGKSTRISVWFVVWMLHRNPNLRVAIVSNGHDLAKGFGEQIRDIVKSHPELGLVLSTSTQAKHEFKLQGYQGGVIAVGIGGALTGRPVDCVSDDTLIESERGEVTAADAFAQGIKTIRAYDHTTGRVVWRDVEAARRIPGRRVVEVTTTSGRTLTCTPDHRVYTSRGYVPAGSLRHGDTLVGLVATGRVSVRQSPCGPEAAGAQRDPSRPGDLLLDGLRAGGDRRGEPDPVLSVRGPGAAQSQVDVFGRVRPVPPSPPDPDLPAVLDRVQTTVLADHVLLQDVREPGALATDGREGQLPLQDRHQLRPVVSVDAPADPGTRRAPVCRVRAGADDDLQAGREDRHPVRADGASHRRGRREQPALEPDHALLDVPCDAPQVEDDTVAVVRSRGDEQVDVYDFQVAGTRNFFGDGVLVHNCLIIDDPYKDDRQADSKAWRQMVRNFWQSVAITRLGPEAPVIVVQTRWRRDDLSGWLLDEYGDDWTSLNIPAQAVDPLKLPETDRQYGRPDPLGREPGEFMESARRRTPSEWLMKMREAGSRGWNAMYQGRPAPVEGSILKREWWRRYDHPLWITNEAGQCLLPGYDELIQSWDLAFKSTADSDFVVGQVWARNGVTAYLVDQVRGRWDFVETCRQIRDLSARWPGATLKLIEDKANGPAVISALEREVTGIVGDEPHGSKEARASAVSPLVEAGNVWLPESAIAPWVSSLIEECAEFPTGTNDDQVDALTQALNRLVLQPFSDGSIFTADDLFDELAETGSYIPSF